VAGISDNAGYALICLVTATVS